MFLLNMWKTFKTVKIITMYTYNRNKLLMTHCLLLS